MSHSLDDASLRELHRDLGLNVSIDCAGHNYNANHASMTLTALYVLRSLVPADAKVQFEAATDAIAHYRSTTLDEVRAAATPSFGADVDAKLAVTSEEQVWNLVGRREAISGVGRFLIEHLTATLRHVNEEASTVDRRATIGRWLAKWLGHALVRDSVGCAAVHGLLRIAFGLGVDFVPDIAFGVATVITNHFRTPMPAKGNDCALAVGDGQDSGAKMLQSVRTVLASEAVRNFDFAAGGDAAPVGGIDGRCYGFFHLPEFAAAVPRLDGANPLITVSKMLDLAAAQFQQYHDFSALHIFTGAAGMQQLMTALDGHVSAEVASDLLTGFWAEALAIVATLPKLEKSRQTKGAPPAPEPRNGPAISDVDSAAILVLETAARKQQSLTPSEFEHQVKLAYAGRVAVQSRTEPDFVAACVAVLVREAAAPAPF